MNQDRKCCCRHGAAIVSAIAFILIAALDFIRVFSGWIVTVDGKEVPIWASIVCGVIALLLALWNFCSCCKKKCNEKCGDKCNDPNHHHNHNRPL